VTANEEFNKLSIPSPSDESFEMRMCLCNSDVLGAPVAAPVVQVFCAVTFLFFAVRCSFVRPPSGRINDSIVASDDKFASRWPRMQRVMQLERHDSYLLF
jgi:hypothetical protein